jgi:deoxyribonuclease V
VGRNFEAELQGNLEAVCRNTALYAQVPQDWQMRLAVKHRWDVNTAEAREIQEKLREKWEGADRLGTIRTVAGLDAAFVLKGSQTFKKPSRWNALRDANRAIGAVVLFSYPEMRELERASAHVPLEFPYVPGFLSFREIPALLAALQKLGKMPDLLFCDGQGYAHPRRIGLASHLGVILDLPSIGCAKSLLIGEHGEVGRRQGEWSAICEGEETIGAALRTRTDCAPMYISAGQRVSLQTALRLTLSVCDGTRVPRPTREADRFVSRTKRETLANPANPSHRKNQ